MTDALALDWAAWWATVDAGFLFLMALPVAVAIAGLLARDAPAPTLHQR